MEKDKNREQDKFAAAFNQKLAHHSLPVDSAMWEGIAAKMAAAQQANAGALLTGSPVTANSRSRKIGWISLSAVASVALLITIGWYLVSDQTPESGKQIASVVHSRVNNESYTKPTVEKLPEMQLADISQTHTGIRKMNSELHDEVQTITPKDSVVVPDNTKPNAEKNTVEENQLQELQNKSEKQDEELVSGADWTDLLLERNPRKPMLIAGISSGMAGSNPGVAGLKSDAMYESFLSTADRPMRTTAALAPADFKNRDYLPSLSAGIKVSLPVSDSWSVETGLQYSYLQTKLSDASWSGYWADMQLHYLGMPVGLTATIARSSKWELYWSGGVMAEKGLNALYREYRDWGNAVFTTTASTHVDGWQWSVYTSVGAGYHLDKHLMLYVDPQLSYFFDNGQPLSIRTEMPLMIGLNAGLRVSL